MLIYSKKAADYARKIHANQKRKDGRPYFSHLEAVASLVVKKKFLYFPRASINNVNKNFEHILAAAFLHDSMEDQGITEKDLKQEGFSVLTIELVKTLTKKRGDNYFDFITGILESGPISTMAAGIKLADLTHNMSDLREGSLKDKYRFAYAVLYPKNYFAINCFS